MSVIFQNVWFIGLSGGVISSLIVKFVTKAILSKEMKVDYKQKVEMANNEIFSAIRPSIAENIFPPKEIIESILKATAKKYGIDKKDLYSINSLCDDLIKEIMENTILSLQQKSLFCDLVARYRNEPHNKEKVNADIIFFRKNNITELFSSTIGLMTGVTEFVITLFLYFQDSSNQFLSMNLYMTMVTLILIGLIIPVSAMWFYNHLTEKKKKKREKIYRHAELINDKNEPPVDTNAVTVK
jgi:hypothetical protein